MGVIGMPSLCQSASPSVTLLCRSIFFEPFDLFSWNFTYMLLSKQDGVQSTWPSYLDSRSRSQVKDLPLNFVSAPYLLNPLIDFHEASLIVWRCAEHITELPRLNFNVTGQGQKIYPRISSPCHISWHLWSIFMKFHSCFPFSKSVCTAHNPAI